jgi:antirestriction protein ArdC
MSSLFHVRVMRDLGRRKEEQTMQNIERQDVYTRITDKIIASLEQGVRPWIKPWDAEQAAGRITRPLRHNGQPYSAINILMLWAASIEQGFAAPMWMTFKQAQELSAHVMKGQKGSLVVFANTITKPEEDGNGNEVLREIPFLKGYTVFNVEQIEGLPEIYYAKSENAAATAAGNGNAGRRSRSDRRDRPPGHRARSTNNSKQQSHPQQDSTSHAAFAIDRGTTC